MPVSPLPEVSGPAMDPSAIDSARMSGYDPAATDRVPKQEMDSEMFMSLLVTQLSNQDPSSPMDTNEMVNQSTQLASMEQMTSMATAQQDLLELQQMMFFAEERSTASDMIGKVVTTDGAEGEPVTGIAEAVTFSSEEGPMVSVGGELHPLSSIAAVAAVNDE